MADLGTLERRVTVLEQEVEGEKLVTRHILEQSRRNSDDLAIIKSRLNAHDARFDQLDSRIDRLDGRVDSIRRDLDGLRRELPGMIGDTMREVLRERDRDRDR